MNDKELIGKVHSSMYHQLKRKGYATAVDVLMDLEILSKTDYELWRNGKVLYLEKVCKVNLKKLPHTSGIFRQRVLLPFASLHQLP